MAINESIEDTGRMVIKLKNGSEFVITRHFLEGKEYYLVNPSGYTTLSIDGIFFDSNII